MLDVPSYLMNTSWLWLVLALASSLLTAQNVEVNRRARQEGFRLNFWRMLMAACFWLPLSLLEKWPLEWTFYGAAMFGGVAMIIGFTIQNELANKHNGRIAILHGPIKAVFVFILWAMIDPIARAHVLQAPLVTIGVVGCLATMVLALAQFRKNDVSWTSFRAVLPIVVLYGMGDVLARLAITPDVLHERLVVFLFVVAATSSIVSLLIWPWRPKPELPMVDRKLIKDSFRAAAGGMANQVCFFMALVLGPSPAYVSMVVLLAPVWLLIYHRWAGIKDDANPIAGTLLVFAAVVLMVLVA
ncbi:MAG: hypothetical protein EON60_10505 [Alphaproteobacteria bacterium]|nr:MAG: hypothetical protein EON60_10505 [Alphaproteobacteria bacterium]